MNLCSVDSVPEHVLAVERRDGVDVHPVAARLSLQRTTF